MATIKQLAARAENIRNNSARLFESLNSRQFYDIALTESEKVKLVQDILRIEAAVIDIRKEIAA